MYRTGVTVSTAFTFFLVGQLLEHTLTLLYTRFGRLGGLACHTGRANPAAALTASGRLVQYARLAAERVVTAKADDFSHRIDNFQIFGGSNVSHGLAADHYPVLEGLFG